MDDPMWSSSSVNNEGILDYPDILIAGVGKTQCWLNSQEHYSTHGRGFPCGLFLESMLQCNSWQLICIQRYCIQSQSEMLWELNLWILILIKLKLQNVIIYYLIFLLHVLTTDYLLIKCSCKFTFVQWFLNTYSLHHYPFRSHLPMHLFGNFITNTSLAWKYSISWNKTWRLFVNC
jgi:hypothetical protein